MSAKIALLALMGLVCVAGVTLVNVAASPTAGPLSIQSSVVCDTCKRLAEEIKENWPDAEPTLESLCNLAGSDDAVKTCMDMLKDAEDIFKNNSPQDICAMVDLCKPPKKNYFFEDFSGRF